MTATLTPQEARERLRTGKKVRFYKKPEKTPVSEISSLRLNDIFPDVPMSDSR